MNIKGRGHSRIFVQGRSDSTFSNFFSLETTGPIKTKADVGWDIESEYKWLMSHDQNWPPCPYMVKTFKNLLLWNQKADDLES